MDGRVWSGTFETGAAAAAGAKRRDARRRPPASGEIAAAEGSASRGGAGGAASTGLVQFIAGGGLRVLERREEWSRYERGAGRRNRWAAGCPRRWGGPIPAASLFARRRRPEFNQTPRARADLRGAGATWWMPSQAGSAVKSFFFF